MDKIGERIKQRREGLGLSQSDLANKIGLTSAAISLLEKGDRKPSYEMILKLSDVLGVTTDFLMGRSNENKIEISFRGAENLTSEMQKQVESYAKFLIQQKKAEKGDNTNGSK